MKTPRRLVKAVRRRADFRCEYCRLPQAFVFTPFQVDHIRAKKHLGKTALSNLAFACFSCNQFKGDNIAGLDPRTGKLTRLFNPRRDSWLRHFRWRGATLVGRTAIGRTTIQVLAINWGLRIRVRRELIQEKVFFE